jgi:E3 ubiquitin-protein ligase MARCH6
MEWLSHSQKKHCELCKTPFRFTKLYHPKMPPTLPSGVFFRRAAVHSFKYFLTWCRAVLVFNVWLVVLPYCMRFVWRTLFWVADGGWARDMHTSQHGQNSRASGFQDSTHASQRQDEEKPSSESLNRLGSNLSGMVTGAWDSWMSNTTGPSVAHNDTPPVPLRHASLLSNVGFLNSTTTNPAVDRMILDALEGLIITLVVVIVFILVFLIREWVVQQQPVMNLNALDQEDNAGEEEEIDLQDDLHDPLMDDNESWQDTDSEAGSHVGDSHVADAGTPLDPEELEQPDVERPRRNRRHGFLGIQRQSHSDGAPPNLVVEEFQRQALEAVRTLPPTIRTPMAEGKFDEVLELIQKMPEEEAKATKEKLKHMNDVLEGARGRLRATPIDEAKPPATNPFSIPEDLEEEPESSKHAASSAGLTRPVMPARGTSSIATDIRRDMEDGQASVFSDPSGPMTYPSPPRSPANEDKTPKDAAVHEARTQGAHGDSRDSDEDSIKDAADLRTILDAEDSQLDAELEGLGSSGSSWQQVEGDDIEGSEKSTEHENAADLDINGKGKRKAVDPMDSVPRTTVSDASDPPNRTPSINISPPEQPSLQVERSHSLHERQLSSDVAVESDSAEDVSPLISTAQAFPPSPPLPVDRSSSTSAPLPPSDSSRGQDETNNTHNAEQANGTQAANNVPATQATDSQFQENADLVGLVTDWFWGEFDTREPDSSGEDDEHVVQNLADEAPFVPHVANHNHLDALGDQDNLAEELQDPEVVEAAAQAGVNVNDPDAVDDAEDLEGILELIGMQGPLIGLFQNALFCAILISAAIAAVVFIPYLWGKVVLLFVAHPGDLFVKMPLQLLEAVGNFCLDVICVTGCLLALWTAWFGRMLVLGFNAVFPSLAINATFQGIIDVTKEYVEGGLDRIFKAMVAVSAVDSEYFHMSLDSHAALRSIEGEIAYAFNIVKTVVMAVCNYVAEITLGSIWNKVFAKIPETTIFLSSWYIDKLKYEMGVANQFLSNLFKARGLKLAFDVAETQHAVDPSLAYWSASDRAVAIFAGYAFFTFAGNLYLSRGEPFSSSEQGKRIETMLTEFLQQAGGVLKVILIISIEMIVFPLYCGILLDVALLPLFQSASLSSRIVATQHFPWWSIFLHWFIGTCYMFHFALFVSMCRKIMRSGVLYFIRDPDDPTFHPVRDVLERNVTSQLRKIGFSAMVYGGLVTVCLGGVVWGLWFAFENVLPLRWSSSMPGREFPLDLLFYNFLAPLAIRFFKPLDMLNTMYKWWFHKCARMLRLSNFMFNIEYDDEEGHHVRRTWSALLSGKQGDVANPISDPDNVDLKELGDPDVYFVNDGRYVRAPSTDTVRIPKGSPVFVEVDKNNNRLDGKSENDGVHRKDSPYTKQVYVPPWFRLRIFLFVLAIWLFAAATGVMVTIVPLQLGRGLLGSVSPSDVRLNDIYAFSVGAYILGGIFCVAFWVPSVLSQLWKSQGSTDESQVLPFDNTPSSTFSRIWTTTVRTSTRAASLFYIYGTLLVVLPILCAAVIEAYLLVPLHTYTSGIEPHTVLLLQDWALGVLYARIVALALLRNEESRLSRALRVVLRNGPLDPDVMAATRAFILPGLLFFLLVLGFPVVLASISNTVLAGDETETILTYRLAYPVSAGIVLWIVLFNKANSELKRWKGRIRDEVYLVGERLHNFGERKAKAGATRSGGSNIHGAVGVQ